MKHSFLLISFAAIVAISCNNKPKRSIQATSTEDTTKVIENKIMIPMSSCYSTATSKDTVHLKVEVFEHVVTGNLLFKLYEKDSNNGTFEGQLHGDTLLADYKFMSEGSQSTRQVIFLIKDSVAVEGYGKMEEKNGEMVFKNRSQIIFGKGLVLKKVPCGTN